MTRRWFLSKGPRTRSPLGEDFSSGGDVVRSMAASECNDALSSAVALKLAFCVSTLSGRHGELATGHPHEISPRDIVSRSKGRLYTNSKE